jgi:hypothetical protein
VRVLVRVALDAGWHVNPPAAAAGRIPTALSSAPKAPATLEGVAWPAPARKPPGPGAEPVDLYEGTLDLFGALAVPEGAPPGPRKVGIVLSFQPCDATSCAAPEEVRLDVPLRFAAADGPPRHPTLFR